MDGSKKCLIVAVFRAALFCSFSVATLSHCSEKDCVMLPPPPTSVLVVDATSGARIDDAIVSGVRDDGRELTCGGVSGPSDPGPQYSCSNNDPGNYIVTVMT